MKAIRTLLRVAPLLAPLCFFSPVHAQAAPATASGQTPVRFVTLGTNGGPITFPDRSEPANALVRGKDVVLVDAGDGVAEQLIKAGIRLPQVKAVFISHLHFDHTAGLQGVLGLRYQTDTNSKLKIFGPPGTKALVDGLIASMAPAAAAGYGDKNAIPVAPASTVEVIEMGDKASVNLDDVRVTARQNTHYSFPVGSDMDKRFKSLSFRFDYPGRSIVYTGDTGPSPAVEELAKGADLLVSEMIDVDRTVGAVKQNHAAGGGGGDMNGVIWHLKTHHLTPEAVGQLAGKAGVKSLVITHFVAPGAKAADEMRYEQEIGANYRGPVIIARDLDEF